jgi:hypothetical protein
MKKSVILWLGMAIVLFAHVNPASGSVWYVHPDSALSSIQAGIDFCSNDDTVLVGPGTYLENIDFDGKAITVVSELGPDVTTIDGGSPSNPDSGSCVIFVSGEDTTSVLEGFTLTNGTGTFCVPAGAFLGGGVFCRESSSPTIR